MAVNANAVITYDVSRIRELVSDVITNITPVDTPFRASIATEVVDNKKFEWTEDEIRAPQDNKSIEGDEFSINAASQPATLLNYTQIFQESVEVSRTADKIAKYGRADESDYQITKKVKALNTDIEYAFIGIDNVAVEGNGSTARETASIFQLTDASHKVAVGGALTEDVIVDAIALGYEAGSDLTHCFIPPAATKVIDGFQQTTTGERTRFFRNDDQGINTVVKFYATSLGEVMFIPNRFMKADAVVFCNPMNIKECVFDELEVYELAKTSDSDKFAVVTERGLKAASSKGQVILTGVTF